MMLTPFQSTPFFKVRVRGKSKANITLYFDSGMGGFFDLTLRHYDILKDRNVFNGIQTAYGINSSQGLFGPPRDTTVYRMIAPQTNFGKLTVKNVRVNTTTDNDSRIGTAILKYANVTLDYSNELIYFNPKKNEVADAFYPVYPLSPTLVNGKYIVGLIWDKEQLPNVNPGDEILEIYDKRCENLKPCELFLLSDDTKKETTIATRDANSQVHTTVIHKK